MNRMLFYHYYNPYNNLSDYVLSSLEELRFIFRRIVFVSNSDLSHSHKKSLDNYCEGIITRENKGFDFGGWKDAIIAEGWNSLEKYDSLTFMNDTCFGPFFCYDTIFENDKWWDAFVVKIVSI